MSSSDLIGTPEPFSSPLDELPEPVVRRIQGVIEAFEAELREGRQPSLESCTAGLSWLERKETLRRLLDTEIRHRIGQGESPSANEYHARFPDDREVVVDVFEATGFPAANKRPVLEVGSTERPVGDGSTATPGPGHQLTHADDPAASQPRESLGETDSGTLPLDQGATAFYPNPQISLADPMPLKIGHYEVVRRLGGGSEGLVYQAWDPIHNQFVAIKVPRPSLLDDPRRTERFQEEARRAFGIVHPAIVKVFSLEKDENGQYFIVMEYIEGCHLSTHLSSDGTDHRRVATLIAEIAEGICVAHLAGLVHRDLKPSNILIDRRGKPRIVDFGLALHEDAMSAHAGEVAGTADYMAPEQVRGESHRLDGRADIWALGVILYQMLTSRLPFRGATRSAVFDEIRRREPRPPRGVDESVPRELQRICLKCLSKTIAGRYLTAADLAGDLRAWLADELAREEKHVGSGCQSEGPAPFLLPRGLRPFEALDHAGFLALLPGLQDRDGLPDSLRFWKERIESVDPDLAFSVGLLYGPSGSGKSSMIRAGLLPSLSTDVRVVITEATQLATEQQLDRELRRAFPDLPDHLTTVEALKFLREAPGPRRGKKILIVIDQFEQWLQSHRVDQNVGLVELLRQCDGRAIQALLLVRDDFGMAAMRFMAAVEVKVDEGKNYAILDRFDASHACVVLERFGRGLGCLPPVGDLTNEQSTFLSKAVDGMAEYGKVSQARLSLFTEIFRDKPWTASSLKRVGGTEGVGVAFLDEVLGDGVTDPRRKTHLQAARGILKALLPLPGINIRGHMMSESDLIVAAGHVGRPAAFEELMRVLVGDLKLVSPFAPDQAEHPATERPEHAPTRHYRLTHDYLIPSIRSWLTRAQAATLKGRAEMLLELRASVWGASREPRFLPSITEWLKIIALTQPGARSETHRQMVRAANARHLSRLGVLGILALFALVLVLMASAQIQRSRRETEALSQVAHLLYAKPEEVSRRLDAMAANRPLWRDEVARIVVDPNRSDLEHSRASLALAREEPDGIAILADGLTLTEDFREHQVITRELSRWSNHVAPTLRMVLESPDAGAARQLRAAAGLAALAPSEVLEGDDPEGVVPGLLAEGPSRGEEWGEALCPLHDWLEPSLREVFLDPRRSGPERATAALVLTRFADRTGPAKLAELLMRADVDRFQLVLDRAMEHAAVVTPALLKALQAAPTDAKERAGSAPQRANALAALARLSPSKVPWGWLRPATDPAVRDTLIHQFRALGVSSTALLSRGLEESDPGVRQALLLALGHSSEEPGQTRVGPPVVGGEPTADRVEALFRDDPDPAVHAAAEWLIRQWRGPGRVAALVAGLKGKTRENWSVNGQGMTMLVVPGPSRFVIGDAAWPEFKGRGEARRAAEITRSLAVSAHEVTVEQFLRYNPDYIYDKEICVDDDGPMTKITWHEALKFCRWLSEAENIPEDQMCYPPIDEIDPSLPLTLPKDLLNRTGYRLPMEAEWEMLARAGTETSWFFGDTPKTLPSYAWFLNNAEFQVWPVGLKMPNPFGLFDVHGNAMELCQDDEGVVSGEGKYGVSRGGGYSSLSQATRSAARLPRPLDTRLSFLGMRVVRTIPTKANTRDDIHP